jgi:hypothetical protein
MKLIFTPLSHSIHLFSSFAVEIKESNFRYKPSVYLNDTELQEALKKITTAAEMEEYLKARYKTKKEERPSNRRRLNRAVNNSIRSTARSAVEKAPTTTYSPSTIEEDERQPTNQRNQLSPDALAVEFAEPVEQQEKQRDADDPMEHADEELINKDKNDQQQHAVSAGAGQGDDQPAGTTTNLSNKVGKEEVLEGSPKKTAKKKAIRSPKKQALNKMLLDGSEEDQRALPITADIANIKANSELTSIITKATVDGKQLDTLEVNTLLERASELPISTAPPSQPPAGSLFLFDRAATPNYKRDQHSFGKEAHNKLVVDKEPRIKVYYGSKTDHSLQRRSYFFNSDSPQVRGDGQKELVIVHYLVPPTSAPKGKSPSFGGSDDQVASGSLEAAMKVPQKPLSTINEEEKKGTAAEKSRLAPKEDQPKAFENLVHPAPSIPSQQNPYSKLRALVAIGARLSIPELGLEVFCDAVNDLCKNPPAGCEAAAECGVINYKSLEHTSRELLDVSFDDIQSNPKMEKKWKHLVVDHAFADIIRTLSTAIVEHLTGKVVPLKVRTDLESAVLDDTVSMAMALMGIRKATFSASLKEKIANLASTFTTAPLEWARSQFKLIRHAVIDGDIDFAADLIELALGNKPKLSPE